MHLLFLELGGGGGFFQLGLLAQSGGLDVRTRGKRLLTDNTKGGFRFRKWGGGEG